MLVHFNYDKKTGKQSCKASALESEMREPKFIFYFFFFLLCLPQFPQKQSGDSNTYFLC